MTPEMFFDSEALMIGFWHGFQLVFIAGGTAWTLSLCFKIIKNIIGG